MHNYLDSFFSDLSEVSAKSRQSFPVVSYPALPFSYNFLYIITLRLWQNMLFIMAWKAFMVIKKTWDSIKRQFLSTSLIWQVCYSTSAHPWACPVWTKVRANAVRSIMMMVVRPLTCIALAFLQPMQQHMHSAIPVVLYCEGSGSY